MCIRVSVYRDAYGCVYECVYAPVGWWTNKGQLGCHSFSHSVGVCIYVGIYSQGGHHSVGGAPVGWWTRARVRMTLEQQRRRAHSSW